MTITSICSRINCFSFQEEDRKPLLLLAPIITGIFLATPVGGLFAGGLSLSLFVLKRMWTSNETALEPVSEESSSSEAEEEPASESPVSTPPSECGGFIAQSPPLLASPSPEAPDELETEEGEFEEEELNLEAAEAEAEEEEPVSESPLSTPPLSTPPSEAENEPSSEDF